MPETTPQSTDPESLKRLLTIHRRQLGKLREQAALFGASAPPHILLEIEDIEAVIAELEGQLASQPAEDPPVSRVAGGITIISDNNVIATDGSIAVDGDVTGDVPSETVREPPEQLPEVLDTTNPFDGSIGIISPEHIFGREHLIRRIFDELGKRNNIALIGDRGVGKSSLLKLIEARVSDRLTPPPNDVIYINLEIHNSRQSFYAELADRLNVYPVNDYAIARALRGKQIVLCLDELDVMTWDSFDNQVRRQLRGLANGTQSPLTLVTASRRALENLFPDSSKVDSPLAGIVTPIDVEPFSPAMARQFLIERLKNNAITFSAEQINILVTQSGGNPAKLQQSAAELYRQLVNRR